MIERYPIVNGFPPDYRPTSSYEDAPMPRPDDPGQSEDAHTAPGKSEDAPGQQPAAETKPVDPSEEVVLDTEADADVTTTEPGRRK
jgi:hypothetical protein